MSSQSVNRLRLSRSLSYKKGKLAPQYIGLYRIIEKVGAVAYKLELLVALVGCRVYSMCPSSGSASVFQLRKLRWKLLLCLR